MDFNHSATCEHCAHGCQHPHGEDDEVMHVLTPLVAGVGVRGSKMRNGGTYVDEPSGFTLASDDWRSVRCRFCRDEMMTPAEMIPPFAATDTDGAIVVICDLCRLDMSEGHRPGHNRRRRRRAGRA
jgi:hypothetical protein